MTVSSAVIGATTLLTALIYSILVATGVMSPRRYGETAGGLALGAGVAHCALLVAGRAHG